MKQIVYIPADQLFPHPDNPRKNLGDLTELTDAIRAKGVLQNLTVVPRFRQMTDAEYKQACEDYRANPTEEARCILNQRTVPDGYTIIIGHRRHAAGKLAGLTEFPCVVADMSPQEQFETMMVENIQRSDLTAYEQAEGFQTMLDMGGTVDQVAKKTGVSATTVRNRMKLLELDKKKFDKAESRGGTMTDYIKLNEIKNPTRRNKVLDTIGTAEFNNALKRELEAEKFEAYMVRTRAAIEEADWCHKKTTENCAYNGDYVYCRSYNKWNQGEVQRPGDADTTDYVWADDGNTITLYRKKDPDAVADAAMEKKKRLVEAVKSITNNLEAIATTHQEMREEFIRRFSSISTHSMDIANFAAKTLLYMGNPQQHDHAMDLNKLGNLIGVKAMEKKYALDREAWSGQLFRNSKYVLLCTAYTMLEGSGRKYYGTEWNSDAGLIPAHSPSKRLDLLYECLESIGYEMSEEEKQMQDGTHPLFGVVNRLIEDYHKPDGEADAEEGGSLA